jgi:hypothetical protein
MYLLTILFILILLYTFKVKYAVLISVRQLKYASVFIFTFKYIKLYAQTRRSVYLKLISQSKLLSICIIRIVL